MQTSVLSRHEGTGLYNAPQAILKGVLEAETEITLCSGPRASVFGAIQKLAGDPAVSALLRQHAMELVSAPVAARGVTLAFQAARSGESAMAKGKRPTRTL